MRVNSFLVILEDFQPVALLKMNLSFVQGF